MSVVTHQRMVNYRWGGMARGLTILAAWFVAVVGALFFFPLRLSTVAWGVPLVGLIAFLYTGLFITAHDAMHRTLMPRDPFWNDLLGRICVRLFALFSYAKLLDKHQQHHRTPATLNDPDYHDGKNASLLGWYTHFMLEYVTWGQIAGMGAVFVTLWQLGGVPVENVVFFWALPAILSTWQLFYFGTYLPHLEPAGGYSDQHRACSNAYPRWLSFVTCYHFGYHLEHHQYPYVPWWKLGRLRSELQKSAR